MDIHMPLTGKTVLVTRGKVQAAEFSNQIQEVGGIPIEVPLLSFRHPKRIEYIQENIMKLDTYDWLVFTSKNGVDFFFEFYLELRKKFNAPALPKIAVVGKKTEKALKEKGFHPDVTPNEFVAEGLLDSLKPHIVKGSRFLLARGNLSRSFLVDELTKYGATVTDVIVYETVENRNEQERLLQLLKNKEIDIITFTSPSTVSHFYRLVEKTEWRDWTKNCLFACIGPITKKAAEQMNIPIHVCPKNYTIDDLLSEIINSYK